ncbi:hypothetical protein Celaphus_00004812 [Cervus elaphus hippelaphus]|uniref:Uncharacterized protein n=1 Tax=Cervus elaphus hippelaphus TaxID=46360 RepID=A0A212DBE0_CEREH|nr:hypothetical protein Celaphus_00004812 [Cervus elaphus hippelaphus]
MLKSPALSGSQRINLNLMSRFFHNCLRKPRWIWDVQELRTRLPHHVPVQGLLSRGQELPLFPREGHGHVVKCFYKPTGEQRKE